MPNLGRLGVHLRRHWRIHAAFHLAWIAALAAAFALGAFTGAHYRTVFGVKLSPQGQRIYQQVASHAVEAGQRYEHEQLPPARAARVAQLNSRLPHLKPFTLATPEPVTSTALVRNYSQRAPGAKPELWVVHDTESPNAPGLADVYAIDAWFNNPASQASANYTTDADGNTLLMVPTAEKAWHVAFFNSWAIGDELIGYATQTKWPDAQLRAAAQLAAHDTARYGIPVQQARVSGCTILRPGILEHANLGECGGGHHDAGTHFPLARFIELVKQYAHGGYRPPRRPHHHRRLSSPTLISENGAGQKHLNLPGKR